MWYPHAMSFLNFDLLFHTPETLNLHAVEGWGYLSIVLSLLKSALFYLNRTCAAFLQYALLTYEIMLVNSFPQ